MEENEELKQKLTQLLADSQTKLNEISAINTNVLQKEAAITEIQTKISELKSTSDNNGQAITTLVQESQTLKGQIDTHLQKASELVAGLTTKSQELDTHYNGLINKPSETEPSKLEKINSTYQKIFETGENAERTSTKLKEAENNILGNKEANIVGIKDTITSYEEEIRTKKLQWENSYKVLFEKIEGLLPEATSTGLSKAYQEQGKNYKTPYFIWSLIFIVVIGGMASFAILTLKEAQTVSEAFIKIIARAPFFIPTIWLAVFASKQQSQSRRLKEEYIYKETLAKSYESYKREIDKLPESPDKAEIHKKLIEAMVEMARYNPSQTLQMRHHNDRPPLLLEILNKIKDKNENKAQG